MKKSYKIAQNLVQDLIEFLEKFFFCLQNTIKCISFSIELHSKHIRFSRDNFGLWYLPLSIFKLFALIQSFVNSFVFDFGG